MAKVASDGRAALQETRVKMRGLPERVIRHRGTPADLGVLKQVFELRHYSLGFLNRCPELDAFYWRVVGSGRRPLILDAGANIGASVVYFAAHFSRAHVVALEPAADNFAVLEVNCAGFDVDLRRAAIGAVAGAGTLVDPGQGEWAYRVKSGGSGGEVPVLAAAQLVAEKRAAGHAPFIAKIDIEGGEEELFSADTAWADGFPLLIIELHDWLLTGGASSRNFLKWAAASGRDFVPIGDNVFSITNRAMA